LINVINLPVNVEKAVTNWIRSRYPGKNLEVRITEIWPKEGDDIFEAEVELIESPSKKYILRLQIDGSSGKVAAFSPSGIAI